MDSSALAPARDRSGTTKSSRRLVIAMVAAVLASASTWFYMDYILRAQQVVDAAAHHRPRGNLSDLYPRWLGARELLLHGRNPYSPEVTREIQRGYYGRALDPNRPEDPKDQQGFAYPVYVIFLLAPTVRLSFGVVEAGFRWFLIALAPITVLLWLRLVRWKISREYALVLALFVLGWLPMVQGIKLQQLSLLVAGLLAACGACLSGGWLLLGGGFLALATVKPQLTWPVALWLLVWAASDWRPRKRFVFGFVLVMILLLAGAQLILPGWQRMFLGAIVQYHRYTQNESVLVWMFGAMAGRMVEVLCVLACAVLVWRAHRESAASAAFGSAMALVLALTVVIVPMFAPYNQVLLLPAMVVLIRAAISRATLVPVFRLAGIIGFLLLIWPWIAALALSMTYPWLTPSLRRHLWPMPFYSNFILPIFIAGLAALNHWIHAPSSLREGFAAE